MYYRLNVTAYFAQLTIYSQIYGTYMKLEAFHLLGFQKYYIKMVGLHF